MLTHQVLIIRAQAVQNTIVFRRVPDANRFLPSSLVILPAQPSSRRKNEGIMNCMMA